MKSLTRCLVVAVALASCGDDAATTTIASTSTTSGTPAVCGPLAEVVRLGNEQSLRLNDVMTEIVTVANSGQQVSAAEEAELLDQFRVAIADLGPLTEELAEHYDDAAALADRELAAAIMSVRDATMIVAPILTAAVADATTFEELRFLLQGAFAEPGVTDTITAGSLAALSVDEFSIPQCGFKVSN